MTWTKTFLAAPAMAIALLLAGLFWAMDPTPAPVTIDGRAPAEVNGAPGGRAALEASVASGDADAREIASLALIYLGESRAKADPTLLPQARELIESSLAKQPDDNFPAALAMASLSNASHDFTGSIEWAKRAIEINPYNASSYGLLGDALFEKGHYDAADAAYQKMIDTRPDVGAYVRASYAAQYRNHWHDAIVAMNLAIEAASPVGEQTAYLHHQLGDIYASLRKYDKSYEVNEIGTKLAPGFVPPTVGMAEALIATGRADEAIPIMEHAVRELPSLEYMVKLGDLYHAAGRTADADTMYERATQKLADYRAAGVQPDVDFIRFYADHHVRPWAALHEARFIYRDRPTSAAADALGWMLHAVGRDRAAVRFATRAIAIAGRPDASQHFHAAAIQHALGHDARARQLARRALDINPTFSLFHEAAAKRLAR